MKSIVLVSILALAIGAASSFGQTPDSSHSSISWGANAILVVPDGSGELLSDVGNEIHVWLRDSNGDPVSGFPGNEIGLLWATYDGHSPYCQEPVFGDTGLRAMSDTDSEGHAVIDGALRATAAWPYAVETVVGVGLSSRLFNMWIYWNDMPIWGPDLNNDYIVNISDLSLFAGYYSTSSWQADMNHDNQVGLSDVAIMAASMGASCTSK